jgi:hypothetical protein
MNIFIWLSSSSIFCKKFTLTQITYFLKLYCHTYQDPTLNSTTVGSILHKFVQPPSLIQTVRNRKVWTYGSFIGCNALLYVVPCFIFESLLELGVVGVAVSLLWLLWNMDDVIYLPLLVISNCVNSCTIVMSASFIKVIVCCSLM